MSVPSPIAPVGARKMPTWAALVNASLCDCPGFEPVSQDDCQRLWGGDRERTGLTLGAWRGEDLVGAISLLPGGYRGLLRDLAVRPDARRQGIGAALVEAAVARFHQESLALAEAQDWDAPSFRAFYLALGFQPVRRYLLLRWDLAGPMLSLQVNREVAVRPAALADLDELADLYAHMYRPYWDWKRDGTVPEVRETYRARFAERLAEPAADRVYLVAVQGGQLVGAVTARLAGEAKGSLNPGGVGVLPEHRRQGIGSRLVMEALTWLQQRAVQHVTVWTFSYLDREAPAVGLYRHCGAMVARESLGWEKAL